MKDGPALTAFASRHRITVEEAQELFTSIGPAILDFDEALYLEENPDVRRSIANGEFNSALHFYFLHGREENRSGGPEADNPPEIKFKGPIPPRALRKRVHGHTQLSSFEAVGAAVSKNILDAVRPHISLDASSRVLDFGCGCGRVLVYLEDAVGCQMTGSDIDGEAIAWCRDNLGGFANFVQNGALPPLPLADARFDLVYSVSVFTHLPERMQFQWLRELQRVTRPGGFLLLTTRGIDQVPLTWLQRLRFRMTGFVYVAGGKTPGLPDFYRNAFHSEAYIRRTCSRTFEILDFKPRGIAGEQDWILCRRS
ncbi:MAG: class I SAM-dependent methyltransferase [Methylobacteriaceae bacterium]|nr:class I SAM-dependent methyltransferase [Methylobacteriaceae bacterium]